ncbi:MAG: YeeE/YedE thiosulfate transporter family protein [Bacteroidales bacterium]|nr:YeeE/YedE family protein [Bacteroidales bacterium]MDD2321992.1 YeeE/YedE thiosulfate transporter family protein [Bacteroidales bacterium]MDD3010051.1 YeeE/YedE thiosulfate transporter family protein [Bacteroidales bacterium]MDD3960842.1 YeeE/YedE thiosulfate transporter family protein [Bacteroidales bacterium]MDY0284675.1 YeeE/YedE thiosulfate transporter family protein [Bacteroidales bacterium]
MEKKSRYMNSYLAGFLLGLVLLGAFYFSGRGLGASGAMKSVVVSAVNAVAPDHANETTFYSKYVTGGQKPLISWLVFLAIGMVIGGNFSGIVSDRMKFTIEKGPRISNRTRLIMAVIGGMLFGIGAQLGRGCTSGAALSGMAVLSTAGFLTLIAIFGTGYLIAWMFKKLWL